jgi:hypothetical protein
MCPARNDVERRATVIMSDCRRDPDKNAFDLIPEDPVEFTAGVAS